MPDDTPAPLGAGLDGSGPCPCDRDATYAACCRPLLHGREAETAEQLMRSRYTAFAVGDLAHVFRTWHPRTRPRDLTLPTDRSWTGLRVLSTRDGGSGDETGTVEFAATYETRSGTAVQHEVSRFGRRARRWVYLEAQV